jgi:hypothetical protein
MHLRGVFLFLPPSIPILARAHPRPREFAMDPQIGNLHLLCSWVVSQAYMFTHSHTAQYLHPAPSSWEIVSPQRAVTRLSLQGVDQTPFLPPKTSSIQTWVPTDLMSGAPQLVASLSRILCLTETCILSLLGERLTPLGSTCLVVPGRGSPLVGQEHWARWKHHSESQIEHLESFRNVQAERWTIEAFRKQVY